LSYKVKIQSFEGPFDLLVYLIEKAEMSIYDIRISEITGEYLEYISTMKEMNVEVSSEFLVLAAELLNIKTRMMLPKPEPEGPEVVPEDPRTPLIERILAYKLCKQQSRILKEQAERMEDVFEKPQEDISVYLDNPDEYLSLGLADFARAFGQFITRKQRIEETRKRYTRLERERETMESRMRFIRDAFVRALDAGGITEKSFRELIPTRSMPEEPDGEGSGRGSYTKYDTIVSFASLLQMMRDRYLDAEQKETYGDIIVKPGEVDIRGFDVAAASEEVKKEQEETNA